MKILRLVMRREKAALIPRTQGLIGKGPWGSLVSATAMTGAAATVRW